MKQPDGDDRPSLARGVARVREGERFARRLHAPVAFHLDGIVPEASGPAASATASGDALHSLATGDFA